MKQLGKKIAVLTSLTNLNLEIDVYAEPVI
jgi:hypothetical protein